MLRLVLDICVQRKVSERENNLISEAELQKLCLSDQYLFRFALRHVEAVLRAVKLHRKPQTFKSPQTLHTNH